MVNRVNGVLATIAGLAVSELAAGLLKSRVSPLLAVGEWVIEVTPGSVAEEAISRVGRADKPLLVTGVLLVLLAIGAVLGGQFARRPSVSVGGFAVIAVVGAAAIASRPGTRPLQALAALVAGAVSIYVLRWLSRGTPTHTPAQRETAAGSTRRRFLTNGGLVLAGSAVLAGVGRLASHARVAVESARAKLDLGLVAANAPQGVELGIAGTTPWTTPSVDFYRIDTALSPPLIQPDEWELRIHGMVDRPITLHYQDLLDRGLSDAWITLCCVSNEVGGDLIGNTSWSGVPIRDILAEVGVRAGADALLSRSVDGWTAGTPLAALTDGRNALLAVAMNGRPLPVDHGFPVRQVVPGLYGYVSATKWVTDWEVTRFADFSAYWTDRGWSELGPVKTQARIDTPYAAAKAGRVPVAGVAWAQHRGIERVQLRVDRGPWQEARLASVPNVDTWVQWVWEWDATPGEHELQVRATDATGVPQTAKRADVVPDGATGYHTLSVTVA